MFTDHTSIPYTYPLSLHDALPIFEANLRDQPTHNMGNVPGYAGRAVSGHMNPKPDIKVTRETMVHAQLDGDNGPGQWVSVVGMQKAIEKAKQSGVGLVGAGHSNHFGAAGHY